MRIFKDKRIHIIVYLIFLIILVGCSDKPEVTEDHMSKTEEIMANEPNVDFVSVTFTPEQKI